MYDTIVPLTRCTTCHQPLHIASISETGVPGEIVAGLTACPAGHEWPIESGVLVFTRDDAPSDPWSRTVATYETYLHKQEVGLLEAAGEVAPLIDSLSAGPTGLLLDICTGEGGLLFNLLPHLDRETEVVSLDMSLAIQRHNRRYRLERYGDRRVSFISADAAHMPFREAAFARVVSFAMANMLDQMALGVREAVRVLDRGGVFTFTHNYVDEDSEGWRLLSAYMREQGIEDFQFLGLETDFRALMDRIGVSWYEIQVIREVIGEPDRDVKGGPLFPYPNERLTELLVRAVK